MPLDTPDLVLEGLVEGEHALRGDTDRVALEFDGMHVGGVLGEEDLPLAGTAHELHLLAGRVAHDPLGEAGALVAEVDLALVEHHAALAGQHGLAADTEVDADELLVLLGPPLTGGRLLVGPQRGGHTGTALRGALGNAVRGRRAGLTRRLARNLAVRRLLAVARRRRRACCP